MSHSHDSIIYDIESPQNGRLKEVTALADAKERRRLGVFAVEGAREIDRALRSHYEAIEFFVCPDVLSDLARAIVVRLKVAAERGGKTVAPRAFAKLAVREGSDGLVVVFRQRIFSLAQMAPVLGEMPLLIAAEGVEKPGNLGALLRSADGAGAAMLVALGGTVDPYNPNAIRGSLGTVFSVPVVSATAAEFADFCRQHGIQIVAAALSDRSQPWHDVDYCRPSAILLGSEKDGLSPDWLVRADHLVQLPMHGVADSLNVAAAGTALMYEALRQRSAPRGS